MGHVAYCASKGGLNGLTRVMKSEWAEHNIQINTISPAVVLTPLGMKVWGDPVRGDPMKAKIPAGRFCEPIEVADAILFLSLSTSDMICGHDLMVDGGYTRGARNMLTAILYCKYIPNMLIISLRLFGAMSRLPAK